jgi:hypothetical protein
VVRALLLFGALGGAALSVAAPAGADSADFIKYLGAHGVDAPTPELRNDFVNLGQAICNHLDAGQGPNRTVDYLVSPQKPRDRDPIPCKIRGLLER